MHVHGVCVKETPTPVDMPVSKYPLTPPPLAIMDMVCKEVEAAEPPRYEDQLKRRGKRAKASEPANAAAEPAAEGSDGDLIEQIERELEQQLMGDNSEDDDAPKPKKAPKSKRAQAKGAPKVKAAPKGRGKAKAKAKPRKDDGCEDPEGAENKASAEQPDVTMNRASKRALDKMARNDGEDDVDIEGKDAALVPAHDDSSDEMLPPPKKARREVLESGEARAKAKPERKPKKTKALEGKEPKKPKAKKAEQSDAEEALPEYPTDPFEPPLHISSNHVYSSAYRLSLQQTGNVAAAQAKGREASAQHRHYGVVARNLVGCFRPPRKPKAPKVPAP